MTNEIQAEIAEIDFTVSNLILKIQGNYHALSALTETLADGLNSAETNLCSIRIIPDGGEPEPLQQAIGFEDLPTLEKQLLVSTAITSTVAIKMVSTLLGCSFGEAADHISNISGSQFESLSPEQVEDAVKRLAQSLHKQPNETFFELKV